MKTPCEIIVWHVLPVIRKEFAKSLIENHNLTQRKVAEKLGITEATVSRYLSGKRGHVDILDKKILNEIKKSANNIAKENGTTVIDETCNICKILKAKNFLEGIKHECE